MRHFHLAGVAAVCSIGICGMSTVSTYAAKPKVNAQQFEGWTNNLEQASAASKATGRPILMFFTGSDWCGFCKRLKAEVFETPEFQAWAKENVILLEVDFPRNTPQPEPLKQQNAAIRSKFRDVNGFPAIRFVSSAGQLVGAMGGYTPGTGPEKWIASANAKLTGEPEPLADDAKPADGLDTPYPLLASYSEGLTAAQKDGRPLLLVISKSNAPEKLQANLEKFLTDESFAKFAEQNLNVAHVKEPIPADSDDGAALAELRKQNRLTSTPVQFLLIDAAKKKVVFKSVVVPNSKAFVLQLQKRLAPLGRKAS